MGLEQHHFLHDHNADTERFLAIHSKRSVQVIDKWVLIIGIIAPFSTLPQIVQVLASHSTDGISLTTWALFTLFSAFWLLYGIVHEELPIIVTNSLWVVFEGALVVSIWMYR